MASVKYRAVVGISYPPDGRAEAGDLIDDLPGKSIKWLLECGAIERADGKADPVPAAPPAGIDDEQGEED